MNYISSSASAVKHLEERKEKKKTDLISRKRKFQCLNMQLIPGAAKQNSSFSSLSKQQHLVSLCSTVLVYYRSFRNKICIRPGHIIHKVREGREKKQKRKLFTLTSKVHRCRFWTTRHPSESSFLLRGGPPGAMGPCRRTRDCTQHLVMGQTTGLRAQETLPSSVWNLSTTSVHLNMRKDCFQRAHQLTEALLEREREGAVGRGRSSSGM